MAHQDAEIIEAVRRGEVDRYAELVDAYQAPSLRLAFSLLGNDEDAKDASQEAFVRAYQSLDRFRGTASFSTWLYRILVNVCKDLAVRRARNPVAARLHDVADDEDAGLFVVAADSAADPSRHAVNTELATHLSLAIGALPMKQRAAFTLHHLHGLPLGEVAQVMRCRVGTVKSHVFRATHTLQQRLRPWLNEKGP